MHQPIHLQQSSQPASPLASSSLTSSHLISPREPLPFQVLLTPPLFCSVRSHAFVTAPSRSSSSNLSETSCRRWSPIIPSSIGANARHHVGKPWGKGLGSRRLSCELTSTCAETRAIACFIFSSLLHSLFFPPHFFFPLPHHTCSSDNTIPRPDISSDPSHPPHPHLR